MKWVAIFGCTVTLSGLLAAQATWADGFARPYGLPEFLLHSSQGYLGVYFREAKVPHAAEIVMLDHDAPASKSGLKVHDVILQLDGKTFDNVQELRHKLHEMSAGRTVSLLISRDDGSRLTVAVQLCDQHALQQNAWLHHFRVSPPVASGFVDQGRARGPAFLDSMIPLPKGLYVGADVNPVRPQLADYFAVPRGTGLLVDNVDAQSPAALAGLKAGDVVFKVNSELMTSKSQWEKALHSHRGQWVQLTVMREKQEQILTMSVGKAQKN